MEPTPATVAVIGLGSFGIATVKNLSEEGFRVTGFESKPYIGGLWHFTEGSETSVLQCRSSPSFRPPRTSGARELTLHLSHDYQYAPDFPHADEVMRYLDDYVDHFDLRPMFRLATPVRYVTRDPESSKWAVTLESSGEVLLFDKVVVATGINNQPTFPQIKGMEKFQGEILHSRDYKGPERFEGKRVVVVGLGNSGGDTSTSLVGYAKKVYLSHRVGSYIIPRYVDGKPFDHALTLRKERARSTLMKTFPWLAEIVFNRYARGIQDRSFNVRPEWKLQPAPSLKFSAPVVADSLIEYLESGDLTSVSGIKEFVGPDEVLIDTGEVINVDAVIWCTGYLTDFSFLDPRFDPTAASPARWNETPGSRGRPLLRLYHNIFPLEEHDSLAFVGYVAFPGPAFQTQDLASMALAQVWKGNSALPPREEMERALDAHEEWVCGLAGRGRTHPAWVSWPEWMDWVNETAGTGLRRNLGWGTEGWRFWREDRMLYRAVVDGIYSPHVFRLFETGKRKVWDGAREEIARVNEDREGSDRAEKGGEDE
ncbi:related to flavin depend monooxygenase that catalyses the oxidation of rubrofusarin to 9-hydroxyrubrofusarin [Cephalotrichum gorgonifer]|uniref:Related to flavin depend monooxygenase that catalyses the oxidation of rubrofusarin to 9-hydroxyrubrofusarin n=1 Tax=Cephalotrichum gorgonifer TaxID=2041049 RepID=A0AAE8MSI3_9PEZI|nr:related to flavin depend monooxygenase that catalyses the oxidation of rubrofusarin to 9-hydroxyrubrofusarin [Cephalotrichum gorgonifer]